MKQNKIVALWLLAVSCLIVVMVLLGGWVRLTRSGLSMVEWHVATGVVPPLGAEAWNEVFSKYRQTPEYREINVDMSLEQFKRIYYREYSHRILGRLTGLSFVVPLFVFLVRGTLPWRRAPAYLAIGILFALQGLVGWLMVASGLIDQPQVSHYRLTLHLLCALALLAACLWLAFEHASVRPARLCGSASVPIRALSVALLLAICVQIAAGGLVAGLKAGHLSNTFPKMFGQWIPQGLMWMQPWIRNVVENHATVHFQHRWFAFVVLGTGLALVLRLRRESGYSSQLRVSTSVLFHFLLLQVLLGVVVIILQVPIALASLHQAVALAIFCLALFICHRIFRA